MLRLQQRKPSRVFDPRTITSILFVELTRLGDVVTMLPAIQSLRRTCPLAKISVVVDSNYKEMFEFLPIVDEVIGCEDSRTVSGFNRTLKRFQSRSFDMICSMSPSSRNALMTLRTPSKMKIGYFDIHDTVTPFLYSSAVESVGVKMMSKEVYSMENINVRAEKICRALDIPVQKNVEWEIPETRIASMREKLKNSGYENNGKLVVIHPFSAWEYRQWGMKNFLSIANELIRKHHARVVFIGRTEEWGRIDPALYQRDDKIIRFNDFNIGEILVLMRMASLFIGNDSGPLHLAAAVGTPAIGLFGPASPSLTGTKSEQNVYIYHKVECSPCRQVTCVRPENPCMNLISDEEVFHAAQKILQSGNKVSQR